MEDQRSSSQKPHVRYLQHGCRSAHKQLGLLVEIRTRYHILPCVTSSEGFHDETCSLEIISKAASFESDVEQLRHQFGLSGGKQEKPTLMPIL